MFTEKVECVEEDLAWLLEAARSGELPVARLKDLVTASRSWEAKVAALQTDSARLISLREGHGDGGASVLRDQAGKSKFQARRSLGAAEVLDEMPGLRSAVDAGEVSLANAERLADVAQRTAPEAVDSASDLLAQAKQLPPDRFAREASAWTQRHQADHGHEEWLSKRRRRYLRTWKQQDGMVRLDGLLDPETGTRICSRLQGTAEELRRQDQQSARTGDAPAAGSPDSGGTTDADGSPRSGEPAADSPGSAVGAGTDRDEGRSWDQLRADALDLLTSGTAEGAKDRGGSGGRPKAEVIVVADIGVLTGDDLTGRCEIPGTGPVPPAVLERIACDAHLTGLLFADGKPLHHGARVRTATTKQWRALIARDGGCIGCGAEPSRCQAHHVVPYAQSRRTDIENLVLVCWRCHHNIHDHNWQVTHQNGKPALEPPDSQAPPNPANNSQHPHDGFAGVADEHPQLPPNPANRQHPHNTRNARRPQPSHIRQPTRTRTDSTPSRPGPSHPPTSGPDPPPQTAPALFPA